MLRTRLFNTGFLLVFCIALLNILAIKLYLYWTTSWFDVIMHFLGGFWVALSVLWFLYGRKKQVATDFFGAVRIGVAGAIIIGILWEAYELAFGITSLADGIHYLTDTGSDLAMDTIGGFFGSWYSFRVLSKEYIEKL